MARTTFRDRVEAGDVLAGRLGHYAGRSDVLVLALPRGGVPVAARVAQALGAPLDVFVVRKLGVPGHEELAMGAIASGGVRVVNEQVAGRLGLGEADLRRAAETEGRELARRERRYREDRPPPDLGGPVCPPSEHGKGTDDARGRPQKCSANHHIERDGGGVHRIGSRFRTASAASSRMVRRPP